MLDDLIEKAGKTHRKLLKAEAQHKTKKAEKKHRQLLLLNLQINKEKHKEGSPLTALL